MRTALYLRFPRLKLPYVRAAFYAHGAQRGPMAYYKRPGIVRLQGIRRGVLIYWWLG